jgi:hypothetical protein
MRVFHSEALSHPSHLWIKEGQRDGVGLHFSFPRTRPRLIGWNRKLRPYPSLRPSPHHGT